MAEQAPKKRGLPSKALRDASKENLAEKSVRQKSKF
jgi:hypothetical protein